jgi:hypothetical protein
MIDVVGESYQVLSSTEPGAAVLRQEVEAAIAANGSWEQFLDVRMGAGPTVRIDRLDAASATYDVMVTWGEAQAARSRVHGQDEAVRAADRLALALYDIRNTSRVAD